MDNIFFTQNVVKSTICLTLMVNYCVNSFLTQVYYPLKEQINLLLVHAKLA